ARYINSTGDTMTGALAMSAQRITGVGDPVNPQDVATKAYVDAAAGGVKEIRVKAWGTGSCPACDAGYSQVGCTYRVAAQNSCYTNTHSGWFSTANQGRYFNSSGLAIKTAFRCTSSTDWDQFGGFSVSCTTGDWGYMGIFFGGVDTGVSVTLCRAGYTNSYAVGISICQEN
ncbi:MAG: hypothetical protein KDD37_02030, partial [Bdellovibrionales bacterium]|nr:hypothetical protein [Bdellovibrionales bacterium]